MKRFVFYLSLIFVVSVFASCQKDGKSIVTPVSSGRPYEVLVVADDKCWNSPDSALFHVLDTDVPGLPQPERSFRISRIRPSIFDRSTRLFRNIIITDIQDIYTQTKFKYTRDAYSSPQMIMTIQSPNQEEFAEYVSKNGQVIIDFFTRAEMNREVKLLEKKHNDVLSAKVQNFFDCDIWMPVELASYKVGQQFLWASSNLNDLNFVIYTYPYTSKESFYKGIFHRETRFCDESPHSGSKRRYVYGDCRFHFCRRLVTLRCRVIMHMKYAVCGKWRTMLWEVLSFHMFMWTVRTVGLS